ncbi:hypothetical protein CALCODRAFT_294104 [Calocera cornea HHB12733]|uniref:Uncharacterized protein n=1 Tax=Calocera cornea HHB12733 TaxID=1353952 RepID=A0A165FRR2_9BASI|nr:hypothetical protein CALCODRAFT_294104 [Calocera cornea HHB12733]
MTQRDRVMLNKIAAPSAYYTLHAAGVHVYSSSHQASSYRVERRMDTGNPTSSLVILLGVAGAAVIGSIFIFGCLWRRRRHNRLAAGPSANAVLALPDLDYRFRRPPLSNQPTWSAELPLYCPTYEDPATAQASTPGVSWMSADRPSVSRQSSNRSQPPPYNVAVASLA